MMKFYINNQEVEVRVLPQLQETKDESLDSFSVVLKANNISTPYAPLQPFRIETDNEIHNFVIASDRVSKVSQNEELYLHELQLVQNIKYLDTQLIRNNVFSQPIDNKKRLYFAQTQALNFQTSSGYYVGLPSLETGYQKWLEGLVIGKRDKIDSAKMRVRVFEVGDDNYIRELTGTWTQDRFHGIDFYKEGERYDIDGYGILQSILLNDRTIQLNKWIDIPNDGNKVFIDWLKEKGEGKYLVRVQNDTFMEQLGQADSPFSYTFQFEIEIEYHNYNVYEIIEELLKQRLKKDGDVPLFTLPESGELYDLLTNTIPPNLTFTQCTFFQALKEIFMLFDAIFTLDENNVLGIEYFNDRNLIDFNQEKMSGFQTTISESNYRNGLVNYYQNAIQEEKFPEKSFIGLRNAGLGVGTDNIQFTTPHPIDYVKKLYAQLKGKSGSPLGRIPSWRDGIGNIPVYGEIELDLTPYCFEISLYSLLDIRTPFPIDNSYQNIYQSNALYYTKGGNSIEVRSGSLTDIYGRGVLVLPNAINTAFHRFFGVSDTNFKGSNNDIYSTNYSTDWKKYKLRIEYLTNCSGRVKLESLENKFIGDMLSNQSNGFIDLNKTGLNMLGLSLKLGQPTLSFTRKINRFESRIKKGDYIIYNNEYWVANVCSSTIIDGDNIQENIEFTKNFNSLSTNVRIDQEKRLSNISAELTTKCEDEFIEYLYITQNGSLGIGLDLPVFRVSYLEKVISDTFFPTGNFTSVDVAVLSTKYDDGTEITFGSKNQTTTNLYIPMIKYGFGNAICLEMSFNSPISAGKQTTINDIWYGDKYYTIEYLYTDDEGWFDKVDVKFAEIKDMSNQTFPKLNSSDFTVRATIKDFPYYKKPNEVFALNYELVCLPEPNRENIDFIGSAFINNNSLVKNRPKEKTYLHYETDDNFKYSILDKYGSFNNVVEVSLQEIGGVINKIRMIINTGLEETPKAWALCNEKGEILFASNECLSFNNGKLTIYFYTSTKRV